MNPMQALSGFIRKGFTPQNIVSSMLKNNSNPMLNNLMNMANSGNEQGIETFARNLFKEQGRDFDKEFSEFMSQVKK